MERNIPPIAHYPKWQYYCPIGNHSYEIREKGPEWRHPCKDCLIEIFGGQRERGD